MFLVVTLLKIFGSNSTCMSPAVSSNWYGHGFDLGECSSTQAQLVLHNLTALRRHSFSIQNLQFVLSQAAFCLLLEYYTF